MIRYIEEKGSKYYSLNDIADSLKSAIPLTDKQHLAFRGKCQEYVIKKLMAAFRKRFIIDYQEPIILSFGNYYAHWIPCGHFFDLLPEKYRQHDCANDLFKLIDFPEGSPIEFDKIFVRMEIEITAAERLQT